MIALHALSPTIGGATQPHSSGAVARCGRLLSLLRSGLFMCSQTSQVVWSLPLGVCGRTFGALPCCPGLDCAAQPCAALPCLKNKLSSKRHELRPSFLNVRFMQRHLAGIAPSGGSTIRIQWLCKSTWLNTLLLRWLGLAPRSARDWLSKKKGLHQAPASRQPKPSPQLLFLRLAQTVGKAPHLASHAPDGEPKPSQNLHRHFHGRVPTSTPATTGTGAYNAARTMSSSTSSVKKKKLDPHPLSHLQREIQDPSRAPYCPERRTKSLRAWVATSSCTVRSCGSPRRSSQISQSRCFSDVFLEGHLLVAFRGDFSVLQFSSISMIPGLSDSVRLSSGWQTLPSRGSFPPSPNQFGIFLPTRNLWQGVRVPQLRVEARGEEPRIFQPFKPSMSLRHWARQQGRRYVLHQDPRPALTGTSTTLRRELAPVAPQDGFLGATMGAFKYTPE